MYGPACLALSGDEQLGKPPKGPMSVNLKGRKHAQSEQAVPAPELVMAGGQTPWGSDAPPTGNPFTEPAAVTGMPTMPPPPPPAPGEEEEAEAPSARKAPSRNLIIALAAVIVLGGGGYYYTTMGSSDPAPAAPVVHHVPLPGSPAAKAAAAAAKAAAGAKTAKAGKPVAPAKVTTPTKAPTKAGSPAKAGSVPTDTALTAALPGRIGEWSKLVSAKMPATLATYDKGLGTTPRNVQTGLFGGTVDEPYLQVVTGDHSASTSKTALQMLVATVPDLRDMGFVVAKPYAAPHAGYSGTAACTTATMNDVLGVFCVWIDTNTFGMLSAPHRAQRDAQQILDMVRGSVEQ